MQRNFFDTSAVESVVREVMSVNEHAIIIIKSTIPVGYTAQLSQRLNCRNLLFSPEFLRESKALYDNLYPSRIIVGRPEGARTSTKPPAPLLPSFNRARSSPTSTPSSWAPPKPRP